MLETDLFWPIELFSGESDDQLWKLTLDALGEPDDVEPVTGLPDLDSIDPGPFLGAILSAIDLTTLTGHDVVQVLRAQHRQCAHHHSGVYSCVATSSGE